MDYDELKISFHRGEVEGTYLVEASSEDTTVSGTMQLELDEKDLELLALSVASRARGGRRGIGSSAMDRAEALGHQLFEALFKNKIEGRYRRCLERAEREERGMRITLSMRATPELIHVPWELLRDPEEDFLSLSNSTPVVRHVDIVYPHDPLPVQPPMRILGMVSSPSGEEYAQLDTEKEKANLERAVEPLKQDGLVRVRWLENATYEVLQRALRDETFHIFHFIGHGGFDQAAGDGFLVFEGRDQRPRSLRGRALGLLLRDHPSLRLVVLNSCEGARGSATDPFAGVAASLMKLSVPAVIAMQFEITDEAAIVFSSWFYEMIAEGEPVDTALAESRKAIYGGGENELEWATPVLFTRVREGHIFSIGGEEDSQATEARRERLESSRPGSEITAPPEQEEAREAGVGPSPVEPGPERHPATDTGARVDNLVRRGEACLLRREDERALAEFDRALQLDPDSVDALQGRGEANRRLHRTDEAEADFNRALAQDASACRALVGRARTRMDLERLDEASADVDQALQLDPDLAEALVARGFIALHEVPPRKSAAAADFERSVEVDPGSTEGIAGKALLVAERDPVLALGLLEPAIENDPRCLTAILAGGWIRAAKGEDDDALAEFDRALEIDPLSTEARLMRGIFRSSKKGAAEGLEDLQKVLEQRPANQAALTQVGYAHLALGDGAAALEDFNRAIAVPTPSAPATAGRGLAYVALDRFAEAYEEFEEAMKIDPSGESLGVPFGLLLAWRGLVRLRMGRPLEAIDDIKAGLTRGAEETAPILTWLAEARLGAGEIGAALQSLQKATALEPASEEIRAARDKALEALGRESARELSPASEADRNQRNRERLAGSQIEWNWYTDQQGAMVERLSGSEDMLWLCRGRRPQDTLRQVALLFTTERVLWCRRTMFGSPEVGEVAWREVASVGGESVNFELIGRDGKKTQFVVISDKGTDFSDNGLQLDARDLRALVTGLLS